MARKVAIGIQDFEELVEKDLFYVDKTDYIREWWEYGDAVTLITRPRRFGKTLNINMVWHFFSNTLTEQAKLFEGKKVWEHETMRKLQGTFPVIFLSFAGVKETTYEEAVYAICETLSDLYEENRFLLDSDALSISQKKKFKDRLENMDARKAKRALHDLSGYLQKQFGKRVLILLDEYDTPMQEAYLHGYWNEMAEFIRSMFNYTFKTNPHMERGLMTGITRISPESMFSDLNNITVVTTTTKKYESSFGFTEKEVFDAMDEFGWTDKEGVKIWYDGFIFGNTKDIYNPWSIINYLQAGKFDTYWANTSSNALAGRLLLEGERDIQMSFEKLLRGEMIECEIDEHVVFQELDQESGVWSLLEASGYLKILSVEEDTPDVIAGKRGRLYSLSLTNRETRLMFGRIVHKWFQMPNSHYNDFLKALLDGNVEEMNQFLNDVVFSMISNFDSGVRPSASAPERFYHGLVLGLIVDLNGRYRIKSNRESGYGRYDVMLFPENPAADDGIILEFKVAKKNASLQESVAAALEQIEKKRYKTELVAAGVSEERIRAYGFAFRGKEVLVGE